MAHTPGPWNTVRSTAGGGSARLDVVSNGTEFQPSFVAGDMMPDDARLIAAAPDLLAACRAVADADRLNVAEINAALRLVDAAIARAEGK